MVTLDFHRGVTAAVEAGPAVAFYKHGWHSWSPTGWVDPTKPVSPIPDEGRRLGHDDPLHAFDARVGGSGVGVSEHPDGSVTLLGALDPGARVWPDGSALRGSTEGESVEWVTIAGKEHAVLREYASLLAARFGRRGGKRVRVWCSWYSFYEDVTEAKMNEVLVGLDGMPFDTVQVDDGWERAVGDWQANAVFPGGMAHMADRIQSAGFTPGLWLAPLIAQSTSYLATERGELLLRDEAGDPVVAGINWGSPYYALDPTADSTLAFLSDLIEEAREWGYRYLKLDFLYPGAFPGVHANPMPREAAYRTACEVMRNAAGDDCYLLACGAPILASLGLFDGIRIGPDVADVWEIPELVALGDESGRGARNALATSINRLWLRDVIDVDPDVVFFRGDTDLDGRTLSALRDLSTITRFVGVSDPPDTLDEDQRIDLSATLREDPGATRRSRYGWDIDGRAVDFSWVLGERNSPTVVGGA
jgi:alpha-galactosidase